MQYFQNKFFEKFVAGKCSRGEYLCVEGKEFKNFIFLRSGVFEVSFDKSLEDINNLIELMNLKAQSLFNMGQVEARNRSRLWLSF